MPTLQLTITVEDNGKVTVNGPIADKVLSLGLLEFAKSVVLAFAPDQSRIEIPQVVVPQL